MLLVILGGIVAVYSPFLGLTIAAVGILGYLSKRLQKAAEEIGAVEEEADGTS